MTDPRSVGTDPQLRSQVGAASATSIFLGVCLARGRFTPQGCVGFRACTCSHFRS